MKIDFIIISAILVIISFVPFILFPVIGSMEMKKLKHKFKAEVLNLGLNISYKLQWNTNLAGIDILKRKLLFVQTTEKGFYIKHVDLNNISEVKMITQTVQIKEQGKLVHILSKVDLEFFENHSKTLQTITVFDHNLSYSQDFEIKNAQKLVDELQKYLNVQPLLKRTA